VSLPWTTLVLKAADPGLAVCIDVDLGFRSTTNLIPIRRLALVVGEAADAPDARLDIATGALKPLEQRYERRGETAYWYEAPVLGYSAALDFGPTDSHGAILGVDRRFKRPISIRERGWSPEVE
jgi:hypothetical protein